MRQGLHQGLLPLRTDKGHHLVNVVVQGCLEWQNLRVVEVDQILCNPDLCIHAVEVHSVLLDEEASERVVFDVRKDRTNVLARNVLFMDDAAAVVAILSVQGDVSVEFEVAQVVQIGVVAAGCDEEPNALLPDAFQGSCG